MQEFDQTLMRFTMALTQVARAYKSAADKMASHFNLSQATAWPIVMIGRLGDGVRPGAVAAALGLEPSALVRVIDQLIDTGLIVRRDDASDRRAKTLHLTAAGQQCAALLEDALVPFRRKLFENMDESTIEACTRALETLHVVLTGEEVAQGGRKLS